VAITQNVAWMKRQFSACQTPRSMYPSIFNSFPAIRTASACKKSPFSRTAAHTFVSPGDAPAIIVQYVAWMERQFSACQTPHSICLQWFPCYTMLKSMRKSKNRYFLNHILVSHGDAPATIMQYVAWMERQFSACQTPRSMYPSIFNSFPAIWTASAWKKSPFSRTAAHTFVSPGDAPAIIMQYVAWMERQFNACQTPRSIFNSFSVIRCLSNNNNNNA